MTFKERLSTALQKLTEGHPYLRRTSKSSERRINRANVRAGLASGNPGYPYLNTKRQQLLRQAESQRPLRRSEFINLYGYDAWREYVAKHGLPETHKWADAHEG